MNIKAVLSGKHHNDPFWVEIENATYELDDSTLTFVASYDAIWLLDKITANRTLTNICDLVVLGKGLTLAQLYDSEISERISEVFAK